VVARDAHQEMCAEECEAGNNFIVIHTTQNPRASIVGSPINQVKDPTSNTILKNCARFGNEKIEDDRFANQEAFEREEGRYAKARQSVPVF